MNPLQLVFFFVIIIPSAIIHEYAHGWMADRLGDPTARHLGRLTLNPRAHIDPFGTIFMPLILFFISQGSFLFAYAKPVPYNPYNLQNPKRDAAFIGIAGPLSNLLIAFIFGAVIRFLALPGELLALFAIIVFANVLLAIFNLVPIPPLDGSKILYALLPDSTAVFKANLERYGFFILLIFIFFLFPLILPVIDWIFRLFTGLGVFF